MRPNRNLIHFVLAYSLWVVALVELGAAGTFNNDVNSVQMGYRIGGSSRVLTENKWAAVVQNQMLIKDIYEKPTANVMLNAEE